MGKKGGKKKGKGKKSGGGKKGKKTDQSEEQMTVREAVMALDIQRKEKDVEDLMFEIKGLQEKNKRHQARNIRLKEEQEIHIQVLLRQAKEQDQDRDKENVFSCENVEKEMRDLWGQGRIEIKQINELESKIAETDKEYEMVSSQVEMWREYRDVGAKQHSDQIHLLQLELEDMKMNFEDICGHLKWQLDAAKSEVKGHMDQCMAEQQHLASEKAMKQMDARGVQEIHENEWLKTEAEIHRKEVATLCMIVETLEHENIQLISELVDCQEEDLKISRNFIDTGYEVDDENNLMDRRLMSIYKPDYKSPTGTPARAITSGKERPKSALLAAIEDRIFSIKAEDLSEEEEEDEEEILALGNREENILEEQEYLHLGPMELKLLSVKGEPKPIHPLDSDIEIVDGTSSEVTVTRPKWPISTPMLHSVQATP